MTDRQFDIAIIGNSLSAGIAAALLAKNGRKVLRVGLGNAADSAWFFSSIFLEKLLGSLGGRACFTSPQPFQVLSSRSRLTVHGEIPLEDELVREFNEDAAQLIALLNYLRDLGGSINQLLWDNHGLPWPGLKGSARFRYLCLRRKISPAELARPLRTSFLKLDTAGREFLTNLFQGLALLPLDSLRLAEGALLWNHACHEENLAGSAFNDLLERRYRQFHGVIADLADLDKLDFSGSTFRGGIIKGQGPFQAESLIIGNRMAGQLFLPATLKNKLSPSPSIDQFVTTDLQGQLSPLLEKQVIVGGERPMRISLEANESGVTCEISAFALASEHLTRQQLAPVLPFATYEMTRHPTTDRDTLTDQMDPIAGLFAKPLKIGSNIFCADSSILTPGLGPPGAALLGWTLANRLGNYSTGKK